MEQKTVGGKKHSKFIDNSLNLCLVYKAFNVFIVHSAIYGNKSRTKLTHM